MASYSVDPATISAAADQCRATQQVTQDAVQTVPRLFRGIGDALPNGQVVNAADDAAARWAQTLHDLDDSAAALVESLQAAAAVYDKGAARVRAAFGAH